MNRRRCRALVAALALVASAAAGATAAPARASAASASARSASAKICVGLVVDARSIGGHVASSCVKVSPGATGADVLAAGGHSIGYRQDGLICTIDGLPTSGCTGVDDTHYWAYFHRAPGATTWSYSNEGAGTYQPVNHSTEGWVYDDGTSLQPDNVPEATICPPAAMPTPAPTHRARPSPAPSRRTSPKPAAASSAPRATPTSRRSGHAAGSRSAPSASATRPGSAPAATRTSKAVASTPAATTTPSTTLSDSPSAALTGGSSSRSGGSGLGWLSGAVVIAALAVFAGVRWRARRGGRTGS